MSYDIKLTERVSSETILLPVKHIMTGGTYQADYDKLTRAFTPAPIREAWLNITYNYSRYYYEATEGDERFYSQADGSNEKATNLGIRGIYGKTGLESISMLGDMASRIEAKYKDNGKWITTHRKEIVYRDSHGHEILPIETCFQEIKYTKKDVKIDVYEGVNDDYWLPTAGNAIKPLYKLLVFAELRPDGIWTGD